MRIVATQIGPTRRLWLAHASPTLRREAAPSRTSWFVHASRVCVERIAAEALREGKMISAWDEPLTNEAAALPVRLLRALDAAVGDRPSWDWSAKALDTPIRTDQDAIGWFLSSASDVLLLGDVAFEKRRIADHVR